jgi:hypothetical protein
MNTDTKNEDVTPVEVPRIVVRNNKIPPKLGAQVLYVLAERDSVYGAGRARPGVIVDLVVDGSVDGLVNIMVFTNAHADQLPNTHHVKEILHDEDEHKPGTWHWPPPRELVFQNVEVQGEPLDEDELDEEPVSSDPFPSTPDTGSRLAAHIERKGYHTSDAPPPKGFEIDPVAASRPTTPEPFPSEEPESR